MWERRVNKSRRSPAELNGASPRGERCETQPVLENLSVPYTDLRFSYSGHLR